MTQEPFVKQHSRLEAIEQHLVDLDATYGFIARLARENHWHPSFARRVMKEYARFLFIAREGGHPVSPPPIIDKAWHLHLLHTREYWSDFCPNVLGMDLDHIPDTAGPTHQARLAEWSRQTLASYQKYFGEPPPLWTDNRSEGMRAGMRVIALLLMGAGLGAVGTAVALSMISLAAGGVVAIVIGALALQSSYRCGGSGRGNGSDGGCSAFGGCGNDAGGGHGHGGDSGGGHGCGGHGCGGGH
jgi:hypothetical protein